MELPVRALVLIACMGLADSALAGAIYRCSLSDGSVRYSTQTLPNANCALVVSDGGEGKAESHPRWTFLLSSQSADTYLQLASARRKGDSVSLWVLDNYQEAQTAEATKGPYMSAVRRLTVECNTHEVTYHKITYTSEPYGLGDYVGEWRPIGVYRDFATPGSVDDSIATHVCQEN